MELLDIFSGNAFGVVTLTDRINTQELTPGRLGELGIFQIKRINTTSVALYLKNHTLRLVENKSRGGVPQPNDAEKGKLLSLEVPHLPMNDALLADALQNVRVFGVGDEAAARVQALQAKVDEKLGEMRQQIEVTIEYHRVGALKGTILDSDGTTVIHNLFDVFGVSQQTGDLVLDTAGTDVIGKVRAAVRLLEAALGSTVYTRLHAIVGPVLMDKLLSHASVKDWMKANQQDARTMREEDLRYGGVRIHNVVFEEYRGTVGGTPFIAEDQGYLFAEGVPGLFQTYFAPADYAETVNTLGLPFYAKQEPKRMNKGIDMEVQSNPLSICTRPASVIKLIDNA